MRTRSDAFLTGTSVLGVYEDCYDLVVNCEIFDLRRQPFGDALGFDPAKEVLLSLGRRSLAVVRRTVAISPRHQLPRPSESAVVTSWRS